MMSSDRVSRSSGHYVENESGPFGNPNGTTYDHSCWRTPGCPSAEVGCRLSDNVIQL